MSKSMPEYRLHKASGRAFVQWKPLYGKRRVYLPGKYDSPESRQAYEKVIAKVNELRTQTGPRPEPADIVSLNGLCLAYLEWLKAKIDRKTYLDIARAVEHLMREAGTTRIDSFGPLALEAVRDTMIERGLSRNRINRQVRRMKAVFKWGVVREIVKESTQARIQMLPSLKKGWTKAPDHPKIRPVADEHVERLLPYVSPVVRDMICLQRLTGMRSDELTGMRLSELDRSGDVWVYRKEEHKTAHAGKDKIVCIGPRAKEILARHIEDGTDYLFTPAKSFLSRRLEHTKNKKRWPRKSRGEKGATRNRCPRYTAGTYRKALRHGFIKLAKSLGAKDPPKNANFKKWLAGHGVTYFHPHQLRHNVGTDLREKYGIEGAQVVLGNTIDATLIYAEKSLALAKRIASEVG